MTTNERPLTPGDCEYVPVTSIVIGDTLVSSFHTKRQHANEAPTQRQLNTRATFNRVETIHTGTTGRGHAILEFNIDIPGRRVTALNSDTNYVWRVVKVAV